MDTPCEKIINDEEIRELCVSLQNFIFEMILKALEYKRVLLEGGRLMFLVIERSGIFKPEVIKSAS